MSTNPAFQPGYGDPAYPPPAAPYNPPPPSYGVQPAAYDAPPPAYPTKGPAAPQQQPPVGTAAYSASANTVVISQPGAYGYVPHNVYPDNTGAIIFSCCVAWCCCCVFGLIAFIYAVTSNSQATPELAFRRLRISRMLSVAGLVTGIVLYIVFNAIRIALSV